MVKKSPEEIKKIARRMRINIIRMLGAAKSGHPGGSLSATDILATLYFGGVMNINVNNPKDPDRDRFILSKGHAAPVLYAALCELGFIEEDSLLTLRKLHSDLQGHPDSKKVDGVEVCTGSLGQGLSISAGLAAAIKIDGTNQRVYTLLGDGEIEEGQVWEAAMFASHYGLDNLVAIVDNNGLQIDGDVYDVAGLNQIATKFQSFGWQTIDVDGHNIDTLLAAFKAAQLIDAPVCIIAKTIKGKGVSYMENQAGWHGKAPNEEQTKQALQELEMEA